ncbi:MULTISPECIES: class F sortase [unclassified Pseudofrankia]|uniref:class F sortase n=1 Tax=unclassified Pseudofrankia TaxID=2994372 RepID=UPI001F517F5E|nr:MULTISPECIES: class F sortase [unclassified Pseudofrankia]MDT3438889.1 class F sortase [Pseudofrankia sp. BMG5.37]
MLTLVVVLLAGCRAGPDGDTAAGHGDATIGQGSPPAASQAAGKAADPVRLRVPDIAVTAPVVPLDLDAAERLIAPAGFTEVGWNHAGPEPGDDGVAVIAGHVDSKTGPAVFYRLGKLHAGATVLVDRADGTTATFIVDRLAEYAKAEFPDEEVYHSGNGAQLRLITCGGTFNHDIGHYVDNVVVFAHLA